MSTELLQIADGKITSYDGVLSTTVAEALEGKELWATAQCRPPPHGALDETGQGDAFVGLAFCAIRAVVDVDVELGSVRVVELAVAQGRGPRPEPGAAGHPHRSGRHPGARRRPHGEPPHPRGLVRHPDLTGYAPTALDAPAIRIVRLVEERDVVAPFGVQARQRRPGRHRPGSRRRRRPRRHGPALSTASPSARRRRW